MIKFGNTMAVRNGKIGVERYCGQGIFMKGLQAKNFNFVTTKDYNPQFDQQMRK